VNGIIMMSDPVGLEINQLLQILQLASPALPVGGYGYSEGLEALVQHQQVQTAVDLHQWVVQELDRGMIRVDGAVVVRACQATYNRDRATLHYWNRWLAASRESEELRQQTRQMGNALVRLLSNWYPEPEYQALFAVKKPEPAETWTFAVAFGMAAALGHVPMQAAVAAYLQSWATNLVGAGVKLIPLGQTIGQGLLRELQVPIAQATAEILTWADDDLAGCSWGVSLACMTHETLYSRLFRS